MIATMANRLGVEPVKLLEALKATAFKGATNEEMMALCIVANEYGLNPFTKEIYAFPAKGGGIQPVVSVDGWIRLMNAHPQFDGIEFEELVGEDGKPISTSAIIYRKDRTKPTKVTEWFSECFRKTEPWDTRPRRMLRHKATIQCARTAFGFAGIIDEDEIVPTVAVLPVVEPKMKPKEKLTLVPTVEVASTVTSEPTVTPISDVIKRIEDKAAKAKIGQGALLEFIKDVCPVSGNTLAEIATEAEDTLRMVDEGWDDIAKRIKEAK